MKYLSAFGVIALLAATPAAAAPPPPIPAYTVVIPPRFVFGSTIESAARPVRITTCDGRAHYFVSGDDARSIARISPLQKLVIAERTPSVIFSLTRRQTESSGYCATSENQG